MDNEMGAVISIEEIPIDRSPRALASSFTAKLGTRMQGCCLCSLENLTYLHSALTLE